MPMRKAKKIRLAMPEGQIFFSDSFKTLSNSYVYEVEIAEQYVGDTESGWFPGTKFEIVLTKSCKRISVKKNHS